MTSLSCGVPPSEADIKEKSSSRRILIGHFNGSDVVESSTLETAFSVYTVVDDVWKLGLCLFVDSVLFGEPTVTVSMKLFIFVEDGAIFLACLGGNGHLKGHYM